MYATTFYWITVLILKNNQRLYCVMHIHSTCTTANVITRMDQTIWCLKVFYFVHLSFARTSCVHMLSYSCQSFGCSAHKEHRDIIERPGDNASVLGGTSLIVIITSRQPVWYISAHWTVDRLRGRCRFFDLRGRNLLERKSADFGSCIKLFTNMKVRIGSMKEASYYVITH